MLNIIVLGPPGCGKGTQSENITGKYGLTHISTGEILREEVELQTHIGQIVKTFIDKGSLVPDGIMMQQIFVSAVNLNNSKGLLFDGFPRTILQAEYLDDVLKIYDKKISLVINLEVEEQELYNRIKHRAANSKRSDDQLEIAKNRLEVYYKKTYPLINYYLKQNKLKSISGMAEISEVFGRISSAIDEVIKKH